MNRRRITRTLALASLVVLAALVAVAQAAGATSPGATATASAGPQVRPFDGRFNDRQCGGQKLCGTGTVSGFGRVRTELTLGVAAAPAPGCLGGKGPRTVTLESDAKSTMRLAVQGGACGTRAWGTFKIVSGTGVFADAKGSGIIWGTPLSVRYFGVITLTK